MQEPPKIGSFWIANKCYRSRPVMYSPVVTGNYLLDIDGTNLLIFSLKKQFQLIKQIPVLSKQDQYCAKLKRLTDNFVAVFGMTTFHIVNISEQKIVQSYQLQSMIQTLQINKNYITLITSDLQQQQIKLLHCWKISSDGKIIKTYQVSRLEFPSYEDCTEENIRIRIIMSIDNNPRIYIFWLNTNQMLEIDPIKRHQEKYSRTNPIVQLRDIDKDRYAEVQGNVIHIVSKNGGKEMAQIINKDQKFMKIFFNQQNTTQIYTFSNHGLKMWKLQKNSTPVSYQSSQKYNIQQLFFDNSNRLYGVITQSNHILCWQKPQQCTIHHFPRQQIKKILKMNQTQLCLLLQATASRQQQNQFHVEKYNKMEIYDLEKDCQIAKKAVLKFQYKIDIQSAIVSGNDTVRFILKEQTENQQKKHIFRWSPFVEDKKKQVKKRQIIGAKNFDWIKLFPFDRIVTMTLPKGQDSGDTYSVFGTKKGSPIKTQICLFDFSAKKFGDYDLNGKVSKIQMNSDNNLYVVVDDKLSVYNIDSSSKNRLQKIHQLQVNVSSLWSLYNYIIIQRESMFTVYDGQFQLLMKEEVGEYDEGKQQYKVLEVNKRQFLLATNNKKMLFDLEKEECKDLELLPKSQPQLTEIMSGRVVIAEKGLKAYPYYSDFGSV